MAGCIGVPPHTGRGPQLLWVYAAPVQRVAKMRSPEQFHGNGDAVIVSALLQEGLRGLHDMLGSSEIAQHRAERHLLGSANTFSVLVHFALARRRDKANRSSWQPFYEEVCHRNAELRKLSDGKILAKAERTALYLFLVELEDWLVPEVLRQVKE